MLHVQCVIPTKTFLKWKFEATGDDTKVVMALKEFFSYLGDDSTATPDSPDEPEYGHTSATG